MPPRLVVDSSIAQATVVLDAPIVHVDAVLIAWTTDAPVTGAGADCWALEEDALMKSARANTLGYDSGRSDGTCFG